MTYTISATKSNPIIIGDYIHIQTNATKQEIEDNTYVDVYMNNTLVRRYDTTNTRDVNDLLLNGYGFTPTIIGTYDFYFEFANNSETTNVITIIVEEPKTLAENIYILGELIETNLDAMGVDVIENSGLTTLANQILDIAPAVAGIPLTISAELSQSPTSPASGDTVLLSAKIKAIYDDQTNANIDVSGVLQGATVTFKNNNTVLGQAVTGSDGIATYTYTNIAGGDYQFSASFDGTGTDYDSATTSTISTSVPYRHDIILSQSSSTTNTNGDVLIDLQIVDGNTPKNNQVLAINDGTNTYFLNPTDSNGHTTMLANYQKATSITVSWVYDYFENAPEYTPIENIEKVFNIADGSYLSQVWTNRGTYYNIDTSPNFSSYENGVLTATAESGSVITTPFTTDTDWEIEFDLKFGSNGFLYIGESTSLAIGRNNENIEIQRNINGTKTTLNSFANVITSDYDHWNIHYQDGYITVTINGTEMTCTTQVTGVSPYLGLRKHTNGNISIKKFRVIKNTLKIKYTGNSFSTQSAPSYPPFNQVGTSLIDWGDGTREMYTSETWIEHSYESNDTYNIEIKGNITSFPNYGCYSLQIDEITIPEGVTTIGNNAFEYSSLTKVTFPTTLTSISYQAFQNCTNLTNVVFPLGCNIETLSASMFANCSSLTHIDIPSSITSISYRCFYNTSIIDYQLYWNDPPMNYWSDAMPNLTNTYWTIPNGTAANYVAKGFPSDKLIERSA